MTLNFPTNPDIGDTFPEDAVKQWQWNGSSWVDAMGGAV